MPPPVCAQREFQHLVPRPGLARGDPPCARRASQRRVVRARGDPRGDVLRPPGAGAAERPLVAAFGLDDVRPRPLAPRRRPRAQPPRAASHDVRADDLDGLAHRQGRGRGGVEPRTVRRRAKAAPTFVGGGERTRTRRRRVSLLSRRPGGPGGGPRLRLRVVRLGDEIFVEPVRGVAELRRLVHGAGSNLELQKRAVGAFHGGVQRPVPARLGVGHVVVVLSRNGAVQLVNRVEQGEARLHLLGGPRGAGRGRGSGVLSRRRASAQIPVNERRGARTLADDDAESPGVAHAPEPRRLAAHLEVGAVRRLEPARDLHAQAGRDGVQLQAPQRRVLAHAQRPERRLERSPAEGRPGIGLRIRPGPAGGGGRRARRRRVGAAQRRLRRLGRRGRPAAPLARCEKVEGGDALQERAKLVLRRRRRLGSLLALLLANRRARGGHHERRLSRARRAKRRLVAETRRARVLAAEHALEEQTHVLARGRLPLHLVRATRRIFGCSFGVPVSSAALQVSARRVAYATRSSRLRSPPFGPRRRRLLRRFVFVFVFGGTELPQSPRLLLLLRLSLLLRLPSRLRVDALVHDPLVDPGVDDGAERRRVADGEGQVLELGFRREHPHLLGEVAPHLQRLVRHALRLLRVHRVYRAHVVRAVGELDEETSRVLHLEP